MIKSKAIHVQMLVDCFKALKGLLTNVKQMLALPSWLAVSGSSLEVGLVSRNIQGSRCPPPWAGFKVNVACHIICSPHLAFVPISLINYARLIMVSDFL
jgi:hypothetical protein